MLSLKKKLLTAVFFVATLSFSNVMSVGYEQTYSSDAESKRQAQAKEKTTFRRRVFVGLSLAAVVILGAVVFARRSKAKASSSSDLSSDSFVTPPLDPSRSKLKVVEKSDGVAPAPASLSSEQQRIKFFELFDQIADPEHYVRGGYFEQNEEEGHRTFSYSGAGDVAIFKFRIEKYSQWLEKQERTGDWRPVLHKDIFTFPLTPHKSIELEWDAISQKFSSSIVTEE